MDVPFDVVHQHLGKALLDAAEPRRALVHLEEARAIRQAAGAEELLASTLATIAAARRDLDGG